MLQLNRFCTAEGVVTKSRVPIALPSTLRLPVLVEGSTTSVRYHLSAVVLHLGDTPQRGHYRVLLVEPTGGAWLQMMASQLNVLLVLCSIQENSYLLYLRPTPLS